MDVTDPMALGEIRLESRLRVGIRLIKDLLKFHPRIFLIAVGGASLYAVCTVASSFGVAFLVDRVILPRFETGRIGVAAYLTGGAIVIGIGCLRAVGVIVRRSFAGISNWRTVESLTMLLVRQIMNQPSIWHKKRMTGDLVARVGVDSDAAAEVLGPLPFSTSVVLLVFLTGGWLVIVDVPLGLVAISVIPILLLLNVGYQRRIDKHYDTAQHELGALSSAVHESFDAVMIVKAFGAEERETRRLSLISTRLKDARIRAVSARSTFEALLDGVPSLVNILLLVVGAMRVESKNMSVGELTSFIYLFTLLIFPLRIIGYVLSSVPHSASGYKRVREILNESVVCNPQTLLKHALIGIGVEAKSVSFSFGKQLPLVLDNISFSIKSGNTVVIVGATGSGKSTLLAVLAGLLQPDSGHISLAGRHAAIVFQEPFLFSGTIQYNIGLGKTLSDEAVNEALYLAAADDFVSVLPNAINSIIGERGISLSGGQRQRISLARAVAQGADVLLLDDTTSALDTVTEALVIDRLRNAPRKVTTIVVASRPSTIALADEVLFLENGRVTDHGLHTTLMSRNLNYQTLMQSFEHDRKDATR
ncbi:MAG: ABC transporter ATP-binding protein [Actinobacteria bacterium]|nr:MAG: ABC transporter ATP-binding protein [Actinomycetota bacterium]